MRQDIQKVITERERGGSRKRSLKTGMKINPKLFLNINRKGTFEEFRIHMLELCGGWIDSDIISGVDYGSFDSGPIRVSSARHREYGWECKRKNENYNAISRFLKKNLGRPWNDIWSEICAQSDSRSKQGSGFRKHFEWNVAQDIAIINDKPYQFKYGRCSYYDHTYTGYYVHPETGILCENVRVPYVRPKPEVTSIHWYDNTWFLLEVFKDRNLECNCRHFKVPPPPEDKKYYYKDRPAVCHHGNEPTPRPIWYVVSYTFHDPNEVYRTIHHNDYEGPRYGLKDDEVHKVYYRDVPDILAKPIVERRKVANHKELDIIGKYLEGDGNNQSSPKVEPSTLRYKNGSKNVC
jgi:hypothetical protein